MSTFNLATPIAGACWLVLNAASGRKRKAGHRHGETIGIHLKSRWQTSHTCSGSYCPRDMPACPIVSPLRCIRPGRNVCDDRRAPGKSIYSTHQSVRHCQHLRRCVQNSWACCAHYCSKCCHRGSPNQSL